MDAAVIDFIDGIKNYQDLETLRLAFTKVAGHYGLDQFAYLGVNLPRTTQPGPVLLSNYPTGWTDHYMGVGYDQCDPVVTQAQETSLPFFWGTERQLKSLQGRQRQLFNEAGEFAIRRGLTVPIHAARGEFAGVTFATNGSDAVLQDVLSGYGPTLHVIALYYHDKVAGLLHDRLDEPQKPLSLRERECLTWAAKGKSAWDISVILGISEGTVVFHHKNAKKKLGVRSIKQAIVKGVMSGQIRP